MIIGMFLAVIGGISDASMAFAMGLAKRWKWENIWFVWSCSALVILPWLIVFAFVRDPVAAYLKAPDHLLMALLLGTGWGVGAVLFGLGIVRVGMGLGLGIVVSLATALGALIPLLVLQPEAVGTVQGRTVILALVLVVGGIVLCAIAASRRKEEKPLLERESANFMVGLILCVLSGCFSALLNHAIAFSGNIPIVAAEFVRATEPGAAMEIGKGITQLAPILSAGFLANAVYCIFLLFRNRSWKDYVAPNTGSHWFFGVLMSVLQLSGFLILTISAILIGEWGPILAWPIYTVMTILTGNFEGLLRGEWRGSDRKTFVYLSVGIVVLVVSVVVLAYSGWLASQG